MEERTSIMMHLQRRHATSQPSLFSHTHSVTVLFLHVSAPVRKGAVADARLGLA